MKRPSPFAYLIGNPLGCALAGGFGGVGTVLCINDPSGGNLLLGLVALLVCSAAFKARAQIVSYNRWQQDWQRMFGSGEAQDVRGRKTRNAWRIAACVVLWCMSLAGLQALPSASPASHLLALVLVGTSLFFIGWGLRSVTRALHGIARTSEGKAAPDHVVSVCLPVPSRGPARLLRRAPLAAALPDYCQPLLARSQKDQP